MGITALDDVIVMVLVHRVGIFLLTSFLVLQVVFVQIGLLLLVVVDYITV